MATLGEVAEYWAAESQVFKSAYRPWSEKEWERRTAAHSERVKRQQRKVIPVGVAGSALMGGSLASMGRSPSWRKAAVGTAVGTGVGLAGFEGGTALQRRGLRRKMATPEFRAKVESKRRKLSKP